MKESSKIFLAVLNFFGSLFRLCLYCPLYSVSFRQSGEISRAGTLNGNLTKEGDFFFSGFLYRVVYALLNSDVSKLKCFVEEHSGSVGLISKSQSMTGSSSSTVRTYKGQYVLLNIHLSYSVADRP